MTMKIDENKLLAKSNGETICAHTDKLLSQFALLKKIYGRHFDEKKSFCIEYTVKMHDLGKVNSRFQNKIMRVMGLNEYLGSELDDLYKSHNITEIPHGLISAFAVDYKQLAERLGANTAKSLLCAIACHHNRKAADNKNNLIDDGTLSDIACAELERYKRYLPDYVKISKFNTARLWLSPNKSLSSTCDEDLWTEFAYYKGMLNKLDYVASANENDILVECEIKGENAGENVLDFFRRKDYILNGCQKFMLENSDSNIIVTASTGIGKTEAALLWVGDNKAFYTLPLKVAINAIYKRIRDDYYDKNKVAYLHSDTLSNMLSDTNEADSLKDRLTKFSVIKNLSYPLTVCTVDQLFTFVMKSLGTEILPATMSYSKIIIDEIQAYSPRILAFLIYGLSVINRLGGKFCIMTATLPPFIPSLLKENGVEFVMPQEAYSKISKATDKPIIRHNVKLENGEMDIDLIAEKASNNKVLVVVNTVFQAQEIYRKISKKCDKVNLIHSRFTQIDRKSKEDEILSFAKSSENGVWVSTQVVEASLDIDFDILFTEMCSADSLLQRLGRCFRNRDYSKNEPNCFIYLTASANKIYDKEIFTRSFTYLQEQGNGIFTEEQKIAYINKVFDQNDLVKTYIKKIREAINDLKQLIPDYIKKDEAEQKFRDIRSVNMLTRADYQALADKGIFDDFKSNDFGKRILAQNEIRQHTVTVQERTAKYGKIKITRLSEIDGYYLTDNKYSYQEGLINEIDDEAGLC